MDKDVLKILQETYYKNESQYINEMAKINGVIEIHNDNDNSIENNKLKFAHFHYKGIHFKFSKFIPKNVSDLRKMIAFDNEQKKIDDHELTKLVTILNSKPIRKHANFDNVYDYAISLWKGLKDRDIDFID